MLRSRHTAGRHRRARRPWGFLTALVAVLFTASPALGQFSPSGRLEVHYINIGQGGATLIIGPDGTRILYDFGWVSGRTHIVPYLRDRIGLTPADGLHYAIVSHRDADHFTGYRGVVDSGYDVKVANYGPGSTKLGSMMRRNWLTPAAERTTAGAVRTVPVGLRIALGDGAVAIVAAANGAIIGDNREQRLARTETVRNENDRSIVLYIKYRNFDFILDGDLGAGPEACTEHDTAQIDLQTKVANALVQHELIGANGIDVMHVAHHGSESSTSAKYFNLVKPTLALISVGPNQRSFLHPREDVVDRVLIGNSRAACVSAGAVDAVFQTDKGKPGSSSTGRTSQTGTVVGDIKLVTDGQTTFTVSGTGRLTRDGNVTPLPTRSFTLK